MNTEILYCHEVMADNFKDLAEKIARSIAQELNTPELSAFKRLDALAKAFGFKGHSDLIYSTKQISAKKATKDKFLEFLFDDDVLNAITLSFANAFNIPNSKTLYQAVVQARASFVGHQSHALIKIYRSSTHAWGAVPIWLLKTLEIDKDISWFSFMRGRYAYLEHQVDLELFYKAMNACGLPFTTKHYHLDDIEKFTRHERYIPDGFMDDDKKWTDKALQHFLSKGKGMDANIDLNERLERASFEIEIQTEFTKYLNNKG